MVIELGRTYYPEWTKGLITINNVIVSNSLELPWKENRRNVSCIPEGIYPIQKRYSPRFRDHLLVSDVPGRDYILLHPANDASEELRGCIAPVMQLEGSDKGSYSRIALELIMANLAQVNYQNCFIKIYELIDS
ncbi:MAG: DUF5675 family protein [Bacteroidota bacterium]